MFVLSRQEKVIILLIIIAILAVFGWKLYSSEKSTLTIVSAGSERKQSETKILQTEEISDEKICIIHITGAVCQPGVYQLTEGKRIMDAVKEAGGGLQKANLDAVNLAAPVYDGQKIIIPFVMENNHDRIVDDIGNNNVPDLTSQGINHIGLLNINTADSRQLENLPGIGPVLANRILEYREKNSYFKHIEDVMNVTGIGEKKFQEIKEFITVY